MTLGLAVLAFTLFIFPLRTAYLRDLSGIAKPILDVKFGYTTETVSEIATGIGMQGRQLYAISELTVDGIFPALYCSLLSLLLARFVPRAFPNQADLRRIALLPYAGLAFDYAENVTLAILLLGFPGTLPLAPLASLFTIVKWTFGLTSIAAVVIAGLKLLVWDRLMARRRPVVEPALSGQARR